MEMLGTLIGYLASVLLAISLLVNNDLKFRWINSFGCLSFIIYGIMINAFPIIVTNALLLLINLYRLIKLYRASEDFDLVPFDSNDEMVRKFTAFYTKDIKAYFPEFSCIKDTDNIRFMVLRNMAIANLFSATVAADGTAIITINYTVPKYRDYQVGTFIFKNSRKYLLDQGVKRLLYSQPIHKGHAHFLQVMGFSQTVSEGGTQWELVID